MTTLGHPQTSSRVRWAGLAGREQGVSESGALEVVFLHGLTFDRRMWDPVLGHLPRDVRAIAFDLPGHGGSAPLDVPGLAPVVEAIRDAIVEAGLEAPIMVGHSIGAPLAAIYASEYPAAGVVSVDAPIRVEPFAQTLVSLAPQLQSDGFAAVWSRFQDSWGMGLLDDEQRAFLHIEERNKQQLVLSYQFDLLERPLEEVVRWRDEGIARVARAGTPYVALAANAVDPDERAFLVECLPQAEIVVWPVGHHFPHVAEPRRFAELVTSLAEGRKTAPSAAGMP